ncbi:hypothetical protein B0H66DRAFT_316696 [Apodospora peruviana]|uniref:HIT-type domain-containing protein n=1 Tax=Apodospora peruviana TaxID=516989 RepID=A0AAE0HXD0_9PEZI|nr:hypothetical protein B0H66DRAFT_316696 [Apodospora peruviana]
MSELLSKLCSICHANPQKYKCPGCGARTCSLPCIKKHKLRTDCTGRHDPAAYIPREKLRTPAGIDHDYNFISAIDRAKERAERDIVQDLKLVDENQLHPKNEEKAYRKVWVGDQLSHVPVPPHQHHRAGSSASSAPGAFDKHVRRQLRALDIEALNMPPGMMRQKENDTTFNRRTHCINWRIEWFVFGIDQQQLQQQQPTRILHKVLDRKPLNKALEASIAWHHGQLDRQSRKQGLQEDEEEADDDNDKTQNKKQPQWKQKKMPPLQPSDPTQDQTSGTWPASSYTLQYFLTGEWNQFSSGTASVPPTSDENAARLEKWQFFLLQVGVGKPHPKNKNTKVLIPLPSTSKLAEALTGRTVIEFPTLYVFPPAMSLPAGFVQGSADERRPPKRKLDDEEKEDGEEGEERPSKRRQPPPQHQNQSQNGDDLTTTTRGGPSSLRGGRGRGRGVRQQQRLPNQRQQFRQQQQQQNNGGGRGGRGGHRGGASRVAADDNESAEEGEIFDGDGDGDQVMMDSAPPPRAWRVENQETGEEEGEVMDDEQPPEIQSNRPLGLGGLVDYGSSDDE